MTGPSPTSTTAPTVTLPAPASPVVSPSSIHSSSSPSSDSDSSSEGEDDMEMEPQLPNSSPPAFLGTNTTSSTEALSVSPPPSSPEGNTTSSTDQEYYTASEYFRSSDSENDAGDFLAEVVVIADLAPVLTVNTAPVPTADVVPASTASVAGALTAVDANASAADNIGTPVVSLIVQDRTQTPTAAEPLRRSERLRNQSLTAGSALAPAVVTEPVPVPVPGRSTRVRGALVPKAKSTLANRTRPAPVPRVTRLAAVTPETKSRQSPRLKEKALKVSANNKNKVQKKTAT
ncbi:hypothetical protein BGX24_009112 [Mortierella sp. AD032]|nr:hypothetical protein BGX24_009112 [Mortierella sp. AD032]